jgi:hypothetical protein
MSLGLAAVIIAIRTTSNVVKRCLGHGRVRGGGRMTREEDVIRFWLRQQQASQARNRLSVGPREAKRCRPP